MTDQNLQEINAFALAEEMLILNQDFVEIEKYRNFTLLQREFEERQLLNELNQEDDITQH